MNEAIRDITKRIFKGYEYTKGRYYSVDFNRSRTRDENKKYTLSNSLPLIYFRDKKVIAYLKKNGKKFEGVLRVKNVEHHSYTLEKYTTYDNVAFIEYNNVVGIEKVNIEDILAIRFVE